jgi:RNA polymerase sigma factor (TIGR02999 family)
MGELTRLLDLARQGDQNAQKTFFTRMYSELESLAKSTLEKRSPLTLIDAPALVREVYLRLAKLEVLPGYNRTAFLAYAARAMHSVIIDYLRSRAALRNRPEVVTLNTDLLDGMYSGVQIDLLVETLEELAVVDERSYRVVEMRFFAGMEITEVAEVLNISPATVKRDWDKARIFLLHSMKNPKYAAG